MTIVVGLLIASLVLALLVGVLPYFILGSSSGFLAALLVRKWTSSG